MTTAIVIGANSAIGQGLIRQLADAPDIENIIGISRITNQFGHPKLINYVVAQHDESTIRGCCEQIQSLQKDISLIVCCIGSLHDQSNDIFPEKSLDQLNQSKLEYYFHINSILPALWLKHLPSLFKAKQHTQLVFLSARVGSISDNTLGGWYGYRASKAALNMILKSAQVELSRRFPLVTCISYHPGTVDSELSRPFNKTISPSKLFTPHFTAQKLLQILPSLVAENAPYYLDWAGNQIEW